MNQREIVATYLRKHGYDGLYNAAADCGCEVDDLWPCEAPGDDCEPGYKVPCPGADECEAGGACDWHIAARR